MPDPVLVKKFRKTSKRFRGVGTEEVTILGAEQLKRELKHLGGKGVTKALRAGVGKALTVIKKAIRDETPGDAKSIKKSIGSKVKINKKDGVVAKVGINIGKKKGRGYAPHASIYILGSAQRTTKTGANRGRMPANPIVQRGLKKSEGQAAREMIAKMRDVIAAEAGKK